MPRRPLSDHERELAQECKTAVARLRGYGYIDRHQAIDVVAAARRLPRETVERLLTGRPFTTRTRRTS